MTSTETFFQREFAPKRLAFWIFWFGSHIGLFVYGYFKQKDDDSLALLNSIGLSVWTSRGAGLCLAYDCSLILLPVCRNIIKYLRLTFLNRFIPFDENLWFHRQVAYSMLFFTLVHTFAHYINFFKVEVLGLFPTWTVHYKTWAGLTGHFMLLIMVLMYTSAYLPMRNQSFETFWYTHHLSFFFMLCLYFHAYGCFVKTATGICKPYYSYRYALVGGVIYFFERVLREIRSRRATRITKVVAHPERVIEIQFDKRSFRYKPGQYLFLNVPAVSKWQWHPFTITSAPDDQYVSVHIRQVGDFTNALADLLACNNGSSKRSKTESIVIQNKTDTLPTIRVDGAFGAPAEDVFDNEVVILVGCGIGITPFASILKNIWYQHRNNRPSKLRRVEFYWICRDTEAFEWFQSLLKALEASQMEPGFLTFNIYLTQKLRQSTIQNIVINDVSELYDPLTRLTSRTHYGRPNFTQLFDDLTKSIQDGKYLPKKEKGPTNVGVYYCGPAPLARTLKVACKKAANSDIKFSFHKEHF